MDPDDCLEVARHWHDAMGKVDQSFRKLVPYARVLGERGWTVPMWVTWPSIAFLATCKDDADIERFFLEAYTEKGGARFKELMKDLSRCRSLQRWDALLEQTKTGYQRQLYLVVVPSLLTVVDGSLAEVSKQAHRKTDAKRLASQGRKQAESGLRAAVWASLEGFLSAVFKSHQFDQPQPDRLNRHWVLKGRGQPSWTQADCLRLFQALGAICAVEEESPEDMRDLFYDKNLYDELFGMDPT